MREGMESSSEMRKMILESIGCGRIPLSSGNIENKITFGRISDISPDSRSCRFQTLKDQSPNRYTPLLVCRREGVLPKQNEFPLEWEKDFSQPTRCLLVESSLSIPI
jgi:hypothetical protein